MDDSPIENAWLTAADCAARTGVTVKALRLYEQRGLLSPRRTAKGWRLYGATEIGRLHEILALKRLGLSLSRIAVLLQGRAVDLSATLDMQRSALATFLDATERSLALVDAARTKLSSRQSLSIDEIVELARTTQMQDMSIDAIAQRKYEQARPRVAVAIDPALLDRYVGFYRLDFGHLVTITRQGDQLFVKTRRMAVPWELEPESEQKFFFSGQGAQISFDVAPSGAARALVWHGGGFETLAERIDDAEAEREEAELDARIRERRQQPGSDALLREVIAGLQRSDVDYARFIEPLAARLRIGMHRIRAELEPKGEVTSLRFRGVGRVGADVFDVSFGEEQFEWRLGLAPDGKIRFLFWRPMP